MSNERQRNSKKPNRRQSRSQRGIQPAIHLDVEKSERSSALKIDAPAPTKVESPNSLDTLEQLIATVQTPLHKPENLADNALPAAVVDREESSTPAFAPEGTAWPLAIESKLNALIEQSRAFERERIEIVSLREQLSQAIELAESRLGDSQENGGLEKSSDLELQCIECKQEIAKLSTMLVHSRNEYQSLLDFIESDNAPALSAKATDSTESITQNILDKAEAREVELQCEIGQLHEQITFLECELTELRGQTQAPSGDESEMRIQIEKLRSQLLEVRHEAVELRLQNNELSAKLARFQGPGESQRSEALTWEQRKEALLQQLEAETHADEPCDPRKVLEIEKILKQTDSEIDRRDREIADLRSLLEQQSFAHDGIAVGVAAVAEMIESDGMIIAERVRLQEMQKEWEQKQRQSEIEMSLERAKLARERLELQEKLRSFEDANPPQSAAEKQIVKENSRGRWLARLGLRDE